MLPLKLITPIENSLPSINHSIKTLLSTLSAELMQCIISSLSYTLNTPKLLPELLAFTKQGKPILFSISSTLIFSDFNMLIEEATLIPFEERKFKQSILSNVSSD